MSAAEHASKTKENQAGQKIRCIKRARHAELAWTITRNLRLAFYHFHDTKNCLLHLSSWLDMDQDKRNQRYIFVATSIITAIPVFCMVVGAVVILFFINPASAPNADPAIRRVSFWVLQFLLVVVSICGSSLASALKTTSRDIYRGRNIFFIALLILIIILFTFIAVFSIFVDFGIGYWMLFLFVPAFGGIFLAYRVDMAIATNTY